MPSIVVKLKISADELLKYYQGSAKSVMATAANGQTVRFPAEHLRPFVTNDGIDGTYAIFYSTSGKFERIEKLP